MFSKNGTPNSSIDKIYCSCGGEIDTKTKKCNKCKKDYQGPISEDLIKDQTK